MGAKGPGAFERILAEHGVRQKNGRPGPPTTQGKIERWPRTLKPWLHARLDREHLVDRLHACLRSGDAEHHGVVAPQRSG